MNERTLYIASLNRSKYTKVCKHKGHMCDIYFPAFAKTMGFMFIISGSHSGWKRQSLYIGNFSQSNHVLGFVLKNIYIILIAL